MDPLDRGLAWPGNIFSGFNPHANVYNCQVPGSPGSPHEARLSFVESPWLGWDDAGLRQGRDTSGLEHE